ncbi:hypothetical protein GC197_00110 [bacterium]|nr:hypothetical protein [bacterium]
MRILLADSDVPQVEVVQSFLWDRDFEAEIVRQPLECLLAIEEYLPDIVVIHERFFDGLESGASEWVKFIQEARGPIVIVAASDHLARRLFRTETSCTPVLRSDYPLGDLLKAIDIVRNSNIPNSSTA